MQKMSVMSEDVHEYRMRPDFDALHSETGLGDAEQVSLCLFRGLVLVSNGGYRGLSALGYICICPNLR